MNKKSSFSVLGVFMLVAAVSSYAGGEKHGKKREAFQACSKELNIEMPERLAKEQRKIIKACLSEKGFKRRDHSPEARSAREKCFAENNISRPDFKNRISKAQRGELRACLAKKGFSRS